MYKCEGLFCTHTKIDSGYTWSGFGPQVNGTFQGKTLAECQELCVLDEQNSCTAVVYDPNKKTCERLKFQGGLPDFPAENFWTYVPNLGKSIQFEPSELQRLTDYAQSGVTGNQCQEFMLHVDREVFPKLEGRLVAQWTPEHGDAKQFVEVFNFFGRPAMSADVTVAYTPPPSSVSNTTSGIAPANLYFQMTQEKNKKGDLVVGLTDDFSQATKFEYSHLGGMKKGSNCFHLAKASGLHQMGLDGDAAQVKSTSKCSEFLPDGLPVGKPDEWKMKVQGNEWCLAAPDHGSLKAVKVADGGCSPHWQMSVSGVGSGLAFENANAVGTCELFVQEAASLRAEESSTTTCPNINGMWNIHYPFYPGVLDYKAQIQVSGNVGTMNIEEEDLVYHFAIEDECHRIRFCVTPLVEPDDISCTTAGTFFEGTLDSAGNTISWDDDAYPQWTNAFPLHNKCPNMAYYACATGPLAEVDHHKFTCSFAPNYNACEDYCSKQPEAECHFCSDGSCVPNILQYII